MSVVRLNTKQLELLAAIDDNPGRPVQFQFRLVRVATTWFFRADLQLLRTAKLVRRQRKTRLEDLPAGRHYELTDTGRLLVALTRSPAVGWLQSAAAQGGQEPRPRVTVEEQ